MKIEKHQKRVDDVKRYQEENNASIGDACAYVGCTPAAYYASRKYVADPLAFTSKSKAKVKTIAAEPIPTAPRSSRLVCFVGSAEDIREALRNL